MADDYGDWLDWQDERELLEDFLGERDELGEIALGALELAVQNAGLYKSADEALLGFLRTDKWWAKVYDAYLQRRFKSEQEADSEPEKGEE